MWVSTILGEVHSADLRAAFPDMKGFSASNLKYMKAFAQACPDRRFVPQPAALAADLIGQQTAAHWVTPVIGQQTADQLPWFHIVLAHHLSHSLNPIACDRIKSISGNRTDP